MYSGFIFGNGQMKNSRKNCRAPWTYDEKPESEILIEHQEITYFLFMSFFVFKQALITTEIAISCE